MTKFKVISAYDAHQYLLKESAQIVDIRDQISYENDHIEGVFHLTNHNLSRFMEKVALHIPVFVICYHGNSSKGVAQYLCDQGYLDVYNIEGGMAAWRLVEPGD